VNPDTEFLLAQWAAWSRVNSGRVRGYPTRSAFESPTATDDIHITDDQALIIDAAIKKLLKRDKTIGKATVDYFFLRQNLSRLAARMNTSRRTAQCWVTSGVAWIDGVLILEDFFAA
jgi:hypothetical protein